MFAIIESGNKQYKIEKDSIIDVELLHAEKDQIINFDRVLLVSDSDRDNIVVGTPYLKTALVQGRVIDELKDKKVVSFKYKSKSNYHKTIGHRQKYTRLKIEEISLNSPHLSASGGVGN